MFELELTTPQPSSSPPAADVSSIDVSLDSAAAAESSAADRALRSDSDVSVTSEELSAQSSALFTGGWESNSFSAELLRHSSGNTRNSSALPGASPLSPLDATTAGAVAGGGTGAPRSMPPRTRSCVLPVALKTTFDLDRAGRSSSASGSNSDLATYRTLTRGSVGPSSRTLLSASAVAAALSFDSCDGQMPANAPNTGTTTNMQHVIRQQLLAAAASVAPSAKDAQALQWHALQAQHFPPPPPLPLLHAPTSREVPSYAQTQRLPLRAMASSTTAAAPLSGPAGLGSPAASQKHAPFHSQRALLSRGDAHPHVLNQALRDRNDSYSSPSRDVGGQSGSSLLLRWPEPQPADSLSPFVRPRGSEAEQELEQWQRKQVSTRNPHARHAGDEEEDVEQQQFELEL
jgi:hypothetical protein